jgi:hypothetical protein
LASFRDAIRTAIAFALKKGERGTWEYAFRWQTKALVGLLILSMAIAAVDYWVRGILNIQGSLLLVAIVASPLVVIWCLQVVGFFLVLLMGGLYSSSELIRGLCAGALLVLAVAVFGWCAQNGGFSGAECRYEPELCHDE